MSEKRSFKMHPKLLFDVIQRQAGTLGKAITEGVMNAIDAGAKKVNINITDTTVDIRDDGKGFKDQHEIEAFFETFGQPHDESENKRYGCFRMGRGQMFAFGKNYWRTGPFSMLVDIQEFGLDYRLKNDLEPVKGCDITITLYEELGSYTQRCSIDEVKTAAKWVDVPVFINGEQVNKLPADGEWDREDENAYYRFTETGDMKVYNLGIVVRSYGAHSFGCGGTIVSKKQLKLNFARNDVMSDCPVWKAIKKVVNETADRNIRKKKASLNDASRHRLADQILSGDIDVDEAGELPLFTDVNGKHWSIDKLRNKLHEYRNICTSAMRDDCRGARLMDHRLAFVFANETLQRFGVETVDDLVSKVIKKKIDECFSVTLRTYQEMTRDLKSSQLLTDNEKLTSLERAIVRCIERSQRALVDRVCDGRPRKILLGKAGLCEGWTDGVNYIAITHEFLKAAGVETTGWIKIAQLLLHEYCHSEPDSDSHNHTAEFYETYHQYHEVIPEFVANAITYFPGCLSSEGRKLTRKQLLEQDRVGDAVAEAAKLS